MIMPKLNIPLNLEHIEEKESKLSKKDKKAKEHLEKTSEIARNIGYEDIKMKKYKKNKSDLKEEVTIQEQQEAKEVQKEIEE